MSSNGCLHWVDRQPSALVANYKIFHIRAPAPSRPMSAYEFTRIRALDHGAGIPANKRLENRVGKARQLASRAIGERRISQRFWCEIWWRI
jgi:hypothetical protein